MELIERAGDLSQLRTKFESIAEGEGHCILISGEAGIGKTSLIKTFCRERQKECRILQGSCDALFTPRPLAPLYDIALQIDAGLWENSKTIAGKTVFFSRIFHELERQKAATIVIFEDIHWADEATLDFIKFLARRISLLNCLFILTYRSDEIHARHPLKNELGQLPHDSFTRLLLAPLSKQAVDKMAAEKGYRGEDVYDISGGNPFYVSEILASYSAGIPDNVKDAILSVYNRQDEHTSHIWQILSTAPAGFETRYLEKLDRSYVAAVENSLESGILILNGDAICFKHELYRRTIETSLSPFVRIALNKKILGLLLESFEEDQENERIIHHAKNANEYDIAIKHIPLAAKKAARLGSHFEAARLYFSAIEYYLETDDEKLVEFYELYAYECYLINSIKEAIIFQEKSLNIRTKRNNIEKKEKSEQKKTRLWWFEGDREQAERYSNQANQLLNHQPSSRAKAKAFSVMTQLRMLSDEYDECIFWGEKAIAMAKELGDEETLSHALTNVGSIKMLSQSTNQQGIALLRQSLKIALKNSYHEHVARAYSNLGGKGLEIKDYVPAMVALEAGILYCEERDLNFKKQYLLSKKAKILLETGHWDEAYDIVDNLIKNEGHAPIIIFDAFVVLATIKMRRGDNDVLALLYETNATALKTMELQRIIPALVALLEYEWLTGKQYVDQPTLELAINMVKKMGNLFENSEFAFWLFKVRQQIIPNLDIHEAYQAHDASAALRAATIWERAGCPYEQALSLFSGNDAGKRKALTIVISLNAKAIYDKMASEMRAFGIKNIPRGVRTVTRANAALLTGR